MDEAESGKPLLNASKGIQQGLLGVTSVWLS